MATHVTNELRARIAEKLAAEFKAALSDPLNQSRTLIQDRLLQLYVEGADPNSVFKALDAFRRGDAAAGETKVGEAAEWILAHVQLALYGDYLDFPRSCDMRGK